MYMSTLPYILNFVKEILNFQEKIVILHKKLPVFLTESFLYMFYSAVFTSAVPSVFSSAV